MKWLALPILFATAAFVPEFSNVASRWQLTHAFPNGGAETKEMIIETTGSGVALVDYDKDGWLDALLLSGQGGSNRLYRNTGKGTYQEVTGATGMSSTGWSQGVCAGDYDNDGFTDLFVTSWNGNHLYHNRGGENFEDVAPRAGLRSARPHYSTGCAFLDYDGDGRIDLFVANYLIYDPATNPKPGANPFCFYRSLAVSCGPRGLPFDRNQLFHNNGDGTFTEVSEASGVGGPVGHYSLGVLTGDFNGDGRPDVYVAADQTPSLLYINQGNGRFKEEAVFRGAALDGDGKALSGMGVAAADYDGDGWLDIFRTNFSDERETLYRNRGGGEFDDATLSAGLARNTRYVGWGCGFFDFDLDGWKDLLLVNGHAFPEVDRLKIDIHHRDRAILYRNRGDGKFEDVSSRAGPGIAEVHSSRGAAFGDIDNDGQIEVLINNQNETPTLLKAAGPPRGHWLLVRCEGTRSNRSGLGAVVRVTANGRTQMDEVRSGGSYLSQNDLRVHFGLGGAITADRVEISWPSGGKQTLTKVKADQILLVREDAAAGSPRGP
jgi:enediyne biosynthesis protein E4